MNYAELIRNLINQLETIASNAENDSADVLSKHQGGGDESEQVKMMPPQTQKLELLKKAVGVESEFDKEQYELDEPDSACHDDLETLKRNAGIKATVVSAASDDELEQ